MSEGEVVELQKDKARLDYMEANWDNLDYESYLESPKTLRELLDLDIRRAFSATTETATLSECTPLPSLKSESNSAIASSDTGLNTTIPPKSTTSTSG